MLNQLFVFLDGKKTIILGLVAISVPFIVQLGLADPVVGNWILAICGFFGIGAKMITTAAIKTTTTTDPSNLGVALINARVERESK